MDFMKRFVDYSQSMTFSDAIKKAEENSSTPEGQLKELILKTAEVQGRNLNNPENPLWCCEDFRFDSSATGYSVDVVYRPESDYFNFMEDAFYKSYAPGSTWGHVCTWRVHKQPIVRNKVILIDLV